MAYCELQPKRPRLQQTLSRNEEVIIIAVFFSALEAGANVRLELGPASSPQLTLSGVHAEAGQGLAACPAHTLPPTAALLFECLNFGVIWTIACAPRPRLLVVQFPEDSMTLSGGFPRP